MLTMSNLTCDPGYCMCCVAGKALQRLALPAPAPLERITLAPHATPLHKLQRADDEQQLPALLLAPAQAEHHPAVSEAYGYARVQVGLWGQGVLP